MKKIVLPLFAAMMLMMANSCSKCSTCTKSGSPSIKFCEKDYATKSEYDDAVAVATLAGYDCD